MADLKPSTVLLGGAAIAATQASSWKLVAGVQPFTTVMTAHKSIWNSRLKGQVGQPLRLEITDSRGVKVAINQVYILHEVPSDSPHRVSFLVADKRWRWPYKLIVRDFNMPRKTGDRTARQSVPVETQVVVDEYDYYAYSLKPPQGEKWTAQEALEEVLELLEGEGTEAGGYEIESWPIKDQQGGDAGQFTLQGIMLRDHGDVAVARMLSYIPGADIYIRPDGRAVVFDAADLDATEQYFESLPVDTYNGDKPEWINRKAIRPKKVICHYQREVELLLEFEDNYTGQTSAALSPLRPFVENVIPTVDPTTVIPQFDPENNRTNITRVPPGTWVEVGKWLEAMDNDRPLASLPWTFDTIAAHWAKGDLEGVLGARGMDFDENANVAMRVQALRQHFRQTFRINSKIMKRVRSLRAVRVGLLDPVTGARSPAAVWGQACSIPTTKGKYMATRSTSDLSKLAVWRNIDYLAPSQQGVSVIETAPGPAQVSILDEELGIFRIEWITSPYGTVESWIPCNVVDEQGAKETIYRDLSKQDEKPMGPGMKVESGTNGIFLAKRMEMACIVTIVPSSPNNERQFHKVEVKPSDVAALFRKEFRIQDGTGPELELFVPPGEATARFAMSDDATARNSISTLLALDNGEGLEGEEIPGYVLCNEERHLTDHAISLAAEMLAPYADSVQGNVVTRLPSEGPKLVGNMAGATVRVASAPSGKVDLVSQFPGQQRAISRMATMDEASRHIILGIVPFA